MQEDIIQDQISLKEYEGPFKGGKKQYTTASETRERLKAQVSNTASIMGNEFFASAVILLHLSRLRPYQKRRCPRPQNLIRQV